MDDRTTPHSDRIGAAIGATAADVRAPATLRDRIVAHDEPARRRGRGPLLAAAVAIVAVAVAVPPLVGDETTQAPPTIDSIATLALAPAERPGPRVDPRDRRYVAASIGGVRFPNYGYSYDTPNWQVAGARRDDASGRDSLTVAYSDGGRRVGYTVVDGDPLDLPRGGRRVDYAGKRFAVLRRGGALVVTWRQYGRTCVLATRNVPVGDLLSLAGWNVSDGT